MLQDGEEGRLRLALPDLSAPGSVLAMVQAAQRHLRRELGQPVPRCPGHEHALALVLGAGGFEWGCPDGAWRCALGQYALSGWPHFDRAQLPGMLARRLEAAQITGVWGIGVEERDGELMARFQVNERTPGLVATLRDAAAPLPADIQERHRVPRRVEAVVDTSATEPAVRLDELPGASGVQPPCATVAIEFISDRVRPGDELRYAVVNTGATLVLMGGDYGLQRQVKDGWEPAGPDVWFAAVGLIVDPGQRRELTARIPADAAPGAYRLGKTVRVASSTAVGNPWRDPWILRLTARFRVHN